MAVLNGDIVSVAVDSALIAAGASVNTDVAVAEADLGDTVFAALNGDLEAGVVIQDVRITANGTVRFRLANFTAAGIDPAAFRATLLLVKEGG